MPSGPGSAFGGRVREPSKAARYVARLDDEAHRRIAIRLGELLEQRRWSIREFSRQSLVPINAIRQTIRGEHKPGLGKLVAMAEALGVTLDALVDPSAPERVVAAVGDRPQPAEEP